MNVLHRLVRLRRKERRLALGLMSGMSVDGLDLALVRLEGTGPRPRVERISSETRPYPPDLRARIREATRARTREVATLSFELAARWADDVLAFLDRLGMEPGEVDVLASHGQTIAHVPRGTDATPCTLQVGEGDVLAERTGILTVSDFRPRDIAAGGEGAPLVPFADWVLHAEPERTTACHNLGSIANVTVVTPELEDVWAFDTGPANALIDGVVRLRTGDAGAIDVDGRLADVGRVDPGALAFLADRARAFLERPPPRSAGYDDFGPPLAAELVEAHPSAGTEDLLRTAVRFTASTMAGAYGRWVLPRHRDLELVRLSGGGARNPVLAAEIGEALGELGLRVEALPPDWIDAKEAIAFALLGDATVRGIAAGVPGATGARRAACLGKISLGGPEGRIA